MKQFIRNFKKQKTIGLLNICSLSLGVMVATVVGLWAINELSFDNFHKEKENIYRVVEHVTLNNSPTKLGSTFKPLGEKAKDKYPQIKEMSRVFLAHEELRINSVSQSIIDVLATDPNFFSFFTFPLKVGNPASVLSAPNNVVISETAATQYFAGQDAVGQILTIYSQDFIVSGIMKDMPRNSSLRVDFVLPFYGYQINDAWGSNDAYLTFFNIPNEVDVKVIESSLVELIYEALPFFKTLNVYCTLEPFSESHFSEGFMHDPILKGNKPMIMVLVLVALVILIISCINFTNLFISTSFIRAKTVGIMKTHGAKKSSLIHAFYSETACYTGIAITVGVILSWFALPLFNEFIGSQLIIDFSSMQLYVFLLVLFAVTVALAGTFPALYITRFNPIETLNGKFRGKQVSVFQKILIIIQFTASIALLIIVSFMQKQVEFMISKDLGFDKENVLYVRGRQHFGLERYNTLRDEFMKHPFITDVTAKNSLPTEWNQGGAVSNVGSDESTVMEVNLVKPNYFDFLNMKIIDGENPFLLESQDSITPVILNESAVKLLNLTDPINQIIVANDWGRMIIKGVMKNANIRSLRDEVDPQVYMKLHEFYWPVYFFKYTGDPQQTIDVIKQKWDELEPDSPFQYHFLNDAYKDLYESEMNVSKVLTFAMLITFIISVAGLFAMAFYATQRRIKEIGLRKVNGATVKDLLLLLNKDFVVWVLISFGLAVPVAYFCLRSWLSGFIVQTSLNSWIFLLVGIIALLVTLLTTSFQTWQVANMNPVKSLKSE